MGHAQFFTQFLRHFWRSSGTQNGSCNISLESPRFLLSNGIKFTQIGVRSGKLWLPEVGSSKLFFCVFSGEDSGQTGEATGEPRVARCSWSFPLSNAPGLVDQIVVSRKESVREGGCPGGKTRQIFSSFSLFFVCVRAHVWPSSRCRFLTFLVPLESLRYPLS